MKGRGLTEPWTPSKPILGYTDTETVKRDFDETSHHGVKQWSLKIRKQFHLGGFVLLKSSNNHYHAVFDRMVSWVENLEIMAWTALLTHELSPLKYFQMQCIKRSATLRVSTKREKPSPRIVHRYGTQNDQILHFLAYRRLIKRIAKKLN